MSFLAQESRKKKDRQTRRGGESDKGKEHQDTVHRRSQNKIRFPEGSITYAKK